ncbi:MAG: pyruvate carboxylase subunit B [Pseudomonadota bacterium]
MRKIHFVDQTIRDAQQSLWAYLMSNEMILPIAPVMDEVGFQEIATIGSMGITVQVRNLIEDPWDRIRKLAQLITKTPLRGSYMTASLASFDVDTPRDAIALWIERMAANGVNSFWVCDYQTDMERFHYFAKLSRDLGCKVFPALMYTYSPVHDKEHWAKKTRLIAEIKDVVDGIMIEDAGGVINPERTRELITVVKENCDDLPVEFHSHCNVGVAPLCYLEAVKAGADTLHTAVPVLANGTSLPSIMNILENTRHLGYTDDINDEALAKMCSHFKEVAESAGFPKGTVQEYNEYHFEHQIPGGMMTNLHRQLAELKIEDRLEEFIEEAIQVRKDFGYPVMATPFSQIVGAQAVENCMVGERYKRILDQSIKYIGGHYGDPPGPIDSALMARINSIPEAKAILSWKPVNRHKPLEQLRKEVGPDLSDDEFLLQLLIPGMDAKKHAAKVEAATKSKKTAKPSAPAKQTVSGAAMNFPMSFCVTVEGEDFNVTVNGLGSGDGDGSVQEKGAGVKPKRLKEDSPGAIKPMMAGMLVSIKVSPDQVIDQGEQIATIEAMKMLRDVNSPHAGIVKKIFFEEGEMLDSDDILMIVEPKNE